MSLYFITFSSTLYLMNMALDLRNHLVAVLNSYTIYNKHVNIFDKLLEFYFKSVNSTLIFGSKQGEGA